MVVTSTACDQQRNIIPEMKVYLMRHFKVDFSWNNTYNSSEFDSACKVYDSNPIIRNKETVDVNFEKVYVSELPRTAETARAVGLTQNIYKTILLNEVPLKSFTDTSIRLPINVWLIVGRLQWYFNRKRQPENKTQTLQRIKVFISEIESDNKNCFIIGHGFYFSQLKKQLKLHNYTGKSRRYFRNGEIAEFRKN